MKRNLILLVVLAALGAVAYFAFYKDKNGLGEESDLKLKDTADVSRIFMTDMQGRKVDLERTKDGWILNKSITPRKDAIENLLNTMAYQFPTQPVPYAAHNTIVKDMTANATKVEVYNLKGKKILSFFVGGENAAANTTYMMKEGASRPYFYKLLGMDGYLTSRYFLNIDEWRSRTVIDLKSADIRKVEVQYDMFPASGYWLAQENGVVSSSITNINTTKAADYFRFFEKINCVGFENAVTTPDSLMSMLDRMCVISVTDKNKKTISLQLFYVHPNKRTKATQKVNGKDYDINLLYGYDGKNIMTFNPEYLKRVLREAKDFMN